MFIDINFQLWISVYVSCGFLVALIEAIIRYYAGNDITVGSILLFFVYLIIWPIFLICCIIVGLIENFDKVLIKGRIKN